MVGVLLVWGQYQDFGLLTLVIPSFVCCWMSCLPYSQASDRNRQLYYTQTFVLFAGTQLLVLMIQVLHPKVKLSLFFVFFFNIVSPSFCYLFEIKLSPPSSSLTNASTSRRGARESLQEKYSTA